SPSTIDFPIRVPAGGHFHFGIGTTEQGRAVTFQVSVNGAQGTLFSQTLSDPDRWQDASVDLSRWSGREVTLRLQTQSAKTGEVGLWSNPLVTSNTKKSRPNILIYTMDTVRADHTSFNGYGRKTTPFLDQLAASAIVFNDCQAQATWTKASIASLMTSLYSFTHGIRNDADTIPNGAQTLAEQLRAAGYVTSSIVANPFVGRATGLDRGFDYMLEYPVVLRERTETADRATDSAALNKVVFPWLERHHDEPFFVYAHATDPHAPYRPPPPFDAKFANPAENAAFDRSYSGFENSRQYGGGAVFNRESCVKAGLNPDKFIREAIDRYDGEILHNDHSLELLVNKLKELGILQNTLIIVI